MILTVKSQALKRQLAKDVAIKYKESANLFTEFKKNSDQFTIKRWAKRNNGGAKPSNPEEAKTANTSAEKDTAAS